MCGIAGHLAYPRADARAVERMIGALAHRGPDGRGTFQEGPVALGHVRLAIIDLQTGEQPKFNEDGTIAVVFNGEIYNYRELRAELAGRHRFTSESDTEVLVHLYEDLGDEMVNKLDGMFSFALWDARRERLFAARDRFGEKPFLYLEDARGFFFASELGAFGASGLSRREVDRSAVADYLKLLYVPAPKTIWKDVRKLPAGHFLVADRSGIRTRSYWRPPVPGTTRKPVQSPQKVLAELRRSVRSRLRSDVPMGALLSGGIDSSTVVALMAQELGRGVKTFSVGFGRSDDELRFARLVADRYQTDHREIVVTQDLLAQVNQAFGLFSEPMGDSSAIPTVAVFREVSKHVKVALTGDGGDELFAGYDRYRVVERLPKLPRFSIPGLGLDVSRHRTARRAQRLVRVMSAAGIERNLALVEVFNANERASLLGTKEDSNGVAAYGQPDGSANAAMAFDLSVYLPDDMLVKVDIASMGFAVESRAPFLDHVLAECVVPEPFEAKSSWREGKLLLKRAVEPLLPAPILGRSKRGFGSPVGAWLSGPLRELFYDTLDARDACVRDWLDPDAVATAVRGAVERGGNPHQGWALLALESWARRFARPSGTPMASFASFDAHQSALGTSGS
jgi:asparagine synthase (glutamine-hydrolysing)